MLYCCNNKPIPIIELPKLGLQLLWSISRLAMAGMLRRPSRIPDWSLFLNNNSEDYVVPAADLAPFDPRTQDPNIAPWAADTELEEEDIQVMMFWPLGPSYMSHGCSTFVPPCPR